MRELSKRLLEWYDTHARDMPWRVSPADRAAGVLPDPYRVWLSEVMLQQTTVAAVKDYFNAFITRWPHVSDLAAAEDGDVMAQWAGLGYYARARNLLKCARMVVHTYDGVFPKDHAALLKLPGIGPYTAAAVAAIAFEQRQVVLDGNVERVMARLYDVHTPLPQAKAELTTLADRLTPDERCGDYAQAVMDLGATICTPKSPACGICPWSASCKARLSGVAAQLPKKTPKAPKPVRHGTLYLLQRSDGAWLLERRAEKGLLGGMLGWPGSDWVDISQPRPITGAPIKAEWQALTSQVRHTFTHFHLQLSVFYAQCPLKTEGNFVPLSEFRPSDLPTLMRKAYDSLKGHDIILPPSDSFYFQTPEGG